MEVCTGCGKDLPEGVKFCPMCGHPAGEGAVRQPAPPDALVQSPPPPVAMPPQGRQTAPPATPPVGDFPPPRKKGLSRGAKIGIAVGASALLLIAAVVALVIILVVGVVVEPIDVANNFMQAIKEGDLDTAWAYLTRTNRRSEGRSGFEEKIEEYFGNVESYRSGSVEVRNGRARVEMDVVLDNGKKENWYLFLQKVGGDWKVGVVSPVKNPDAEDFDS